MKMPMQDNFATHILTIDVMGGGSNERRGWIRLRRWICFDRRFVHPIDYCGSSICRMGILIRY